MTTPHSVGADDALGAGSVGGYRGRQRARGAAGAAEREAALELDGVGPGADQHLVGDGVDEVAIEAQRYPGAGMDDTDVEVGAIDPHDPVAADDPIDLDHRVGRAVTGTARQRRRRRRRAGGRAPRARNSARWVGESREATVLSS
ncbi:hypothetical protein LQ327_09885 [Actinomycetospora endophytica]|uniref:Uncharacterized protein n=1 Tax=Actinomycetospora endophytica TaxID=2291215 RepID=A0ABS8P823_9PSEU|nr:hypothetical protein [Actinomycetospora endophytica]MCD2193685.1 hypothetical protein [Actinomycetospora endophytica]